MRVGPILLIDDDRDDCQLVEDALRMGKVKNKLICISTGQEALDYLRKSTEQPFLILSDINMPGMGGIELRNKILEEEFLRLKAVPFIFFTTIASHETVVDAYNNMGVQGFFEKPHHINELVELLLEICAYWQKCRHPRN